MKKNILLLLLLVFVSFFAGCNTVSQDGDVVWLENDGALMPMWILGNKNSDKVVLNIHGGPGATSLTSPYDDVSKKLEESTIQAYWDQRGSGSSRGNPEDSTFTIEQFIEDTDLAVETLRALYPGKKIFLQGSSWGGELAAAYVVSAQRQAKLAGWIMCDGSFNEMLCDELCQKWMMDRAREKLAGGEDTGSWQEVLDWLTANPDAVKNFWKENNKDRINDYLNRTHAYVYREPSGAEENHNVEMTLYSPVNLFGWLSGMNKAGDLLAINSPRLDFTAGLANVTIPTLIIWGRHDGRVPVDLANIAYNTISTPAPLKRCAIFENSAHSPKAEEGDAYYATVMDFLGAL